MELITNLIGNVLLFIGLTGICYAITRNRTDPVSINLFRAIWVPIFILIAINAALVATSSAMDWSEGRSLLESKINSNQIPGEVNYWKMSKDKDMFEAINNTLSDYHFTREYEGHAFDCSDMSKMTYVVLEEAGYEPYLAYKINSLGGGHAFLMVSVDDGMIAVEATNQTSIGVSTENPKYYDCYILAGIEAYDFVMNEPGLNITTLPAAMSQYMSQSSSRQA